MMAATNTRPESQPSSDKAAEIWAVLAGVLDPEVPAISVVDLGIVRGVMVSETGAVKLQVTPTYTGCPATALIHEIIKAAVISAGYFEVEIEQVLSPPWTTDWISQEGREKLRAYGIAPPVGEAAVGKALLFGVPPQVSCPKCGSNKTEQVSEFGSTACKAMYKCLSCAEPFEYFKCI